MAIFLLPRISVRTRQLHGRVGLLYPDNTGICIDVEITMYYYSPYCDITHSFVFILLNTNPRCLLLSEGLLASSVCGMMFSTAHRGHNIIHLRGEQLQMPELDKLRDIGQLVLTAPRLIGTVSGRRSSFDNIIFWWVSEYRTTIQRPLLKDDFLKLRGKRGRQ
jgi:hypothetical protein